MLTENTLSFVQDGPRRVCGFPAARDGRNAQTRLETPFCPRPLPHPDCAQDMQHQMTTKRMKPTVVKPTVEKEPIIKIIPGRLNNTLQSSANVTGHHFSPHMYCLISKLGFYSRWC